MVLYINKYFVPEVYCNQVRGGPRDVLSPRPFLCRTLLHFLPAVNLKIIFGGFSWWGGLALQGCATDYAMEMVQKDLDESDDISD